jgi:hypothetical protein
MMMRLLDVICRAASLFSILLLFVFSPLIQANVPVSNQQLMQKNATALPGISYQFVGQNLVIVVDQKRLMEIIPTLQKAGLIDANLSSTQIGFYQSLLATTVSMRFVASLIKKIYLTHSKTDIIHVDTYLLTPDIFGNNGKELCYSFDFDRKLFQKINWQQFQISNLQHIVSNFKASELCQNLIPINPMSI